MRRTQKAHGFQYTCCDWRGLFTYLQICHTVVVYYPLLFTTHDTYAWVCMQISLTQLGSAGYINHRISLKPGKVWNKACVLVNLQSHTFWDSVRQRVRYCNLDTWMCIIQRGFGIIPVPLTLIFANCSTCCTRRCELTLWISQWRIKIKK